MKKILSVILSSLFVVSTMFGFVSCSDEPYEVPPTVSVWDGKTVSIEWYERNPEAKEFVLNSASDLAGLAVLVNGTEAEATRSTGAIEPVDFTGTTIKLNIDVDLNNKPWTPIGQKGAKKYFAGTFDGNGHKITGLSIAGNFSDEATFDGYVALFGAANGTVKNLTVSGEVQGKNAAGIVARANAKCVIENCVSNVNVTGKTKAGGIVCLTNPNSEDENVIIRNCTNNGTVKTGNDGLGGIAGYVNKHTVIENCINNGDIGTLTDEDAGGIVGYATGGDIVIKKCLNNEEISASLNVGGIVGNMPSGNENNLIENCINNGKIVGSNKSSAGGIVGSLSNGILFKSKNTASVYGKFAGGVVGITDSGEITNCNGGSATITSPAFELGFTGQEYVLEVKENEAVGRVLGANGGSNPTGWTKITVADGDGYEDIGTVGICGIYTTWANLEIVDGIFHGNPLAGNTTYILFTDGTWEDKTPGKKYVCGGFSDRKTEWVEANN